MKPKKAYASLLAALLPAAMACDEKSFTDEMMGPDVTTQEEGAEAPAPHVAAKSVTEEEERRDKQHAARMARALMTDAAEVLEVMRRDATLEQLLRDSRGVFVAPNYRPSSEGVLVPRVSDGWGEPYLFEVGGIAVAATHYEEDVVLLLMTKAATKLFDDRPSPHDTELRLIDYVGLRHAGLRLARERDIVFWSDDEDVFSGVELGVVGVALAEGMNTAYRDDISPFELASADPADTPEASLHRALSLR